MKTTVLYFNSESEVREYAEKNGCKYIDNYLEDRREEWAEYYKPFAEIDGCEVGYMMNGGASSLRYCITWKGVKMTNRNDYTQGDKTQELRLCEKTDWQDINEYENRVSEGNKPQKVGKPTAKKLDDWRAYLLDLRRREEEQRDKVYARMVGKIADVCKQFPEAKAVKWDDRGYWNFEVRKNGLEYVVNIQKNGKIYEKLDFVTYKAHYNLSTAEKAARMMQNGLQGVKTISDNYDAWKIQEQTENEYIKQFMGGRPF